MLDEAQDALKRGDLPSATNALVQAVHTHSANPALLDLLQQWTGAVGGKGRELVSAVPQSPGALVLHGCLLMRDGRTMEALQHVLHAIAAGEELGALGKLVDVWTPVDALAAVAPQGIVGAVSHFFGSQADPTIEALLRRALEAHPGDGFLTLLLARLVRDSGRAPEAEALAAAQYEKKPGYHAAVALAGARREQGNSAGAYDAFELALSHMPEDDAVRLDLGDLSVDQAEWERALGWYRQVLEKEPEHEWARPSALLCRIRLENDPALEGELARLAHEEQSQRAAWCCDQSRMYEHALPSRTEAVINMAYHLLQQPEHMEGVRTSVSSLEAPSAVASLREHPATKGVEVSFGEIPEPDPRQPRREVRAQLWVYEGTEARPAVRAPSATVQQAVATVAKGPFDRQMWSSSAAAIGGGVDELAAVMVHPPRAPQDRYPWEWRFRVQVAAAFALAGRGDEGWNALVTILDGPIDWTSSAAALGLMQMAMREPERSPAALTELMRAFEHPRSPIQYACLADVCVRAMLRLPDLPDEVHARLLKERDALDRGE